MPGKPPRCATVAHGTLLSQVFAYSLPRLALNLLTECQKHAGGGKGLRVPEEEEEDDNTKGELKKGGIILSPLPTFKTPTILGLSVSAKRLVTNSKKQQRRASKQRWVRFALPAAAPTVMLATVGGVSTFKCVRFFAS